MYHEIIQSGRQGETILTMIACGEIIELSMIPNANGNKNCYNFICVLRLAFYVSELVKCC